MNDLQFEWLRDYLGKIMGEVMIVNDKLDFIVLLTTGVFIAVVYGNCQRGEK